MDIRMYVRAPVRFGWGGINCEDCTTWCATYARLMTGEDPAEDLRGTYDTETGAKAIIAEAGGLRRLVGDRLEARGWEPVRAARSGAIAVIHTVTGFSDREPYLTAITAIRFGPLWAAMSIAGPCGVAPGKVNHVTGCWRWPARVIAKRCDLLPC